MADFLIVEDEPVELDYLNKVLRSLCTDQERIWTARNGEEALEVFLKERPDVVLTDIYMPIMDGLELTEHIKSESPQTICYILTSFDYFSYAQRAIHAGVEDFVLKPVSKKGLSQLLDKARQILDKARQILETRKAYSSLQRRRNALEARVASDCLQALVFSRNQQMVQDSLGLLGCSGSEQALLIQGNPEILQQAAKYLPVAGLTVIGPAQPDGNILLLIAHDSFDPDQLAAIQSLCQEHQLQTSSVLPDCSGLVDTLGTLEQQNSDLNDLVDKNTPLMEWDLTGMLARVIIEHAEKKERPLFPEKDQKEDFTFVDENTLIRLLPDCIEDQIVGLYGGPIQLTRLEKEDASIQEAMDWYYFQMEDIIQKLNRSQSSRHCREALAWMERNFQKQISLNDVADELHLSVYHLSRLLNQCSESSFSNLLHLMRIQKSKEMIRNGESFKTIAWKTGYSSQSYFSKSFKKLTGVSPSEYRELYEWFLKR